jgi:ornithine carbamoyltransferase
MSGHQPRHFLTLLDLTPDEALRLLRRAGELKRLMRNGERYEPLRNRTLAMIFEKSSTRTRVSFEAGMAQLGGHAIFLSPRDTQLGRGEPIEDSARVLSRMVDAVMIRTFEHESVKRFAAHSRVPVINGLTDRFHPCQLLADMLTYFEHREEMRGRTVAWIGDGNNMCNSYINASRTFDFQLRVACPEGFEPDTAVVEAARDRCTVLRDPIEAAEGADLIVTDVWASMGQEEEQRHRKQIFATFQVTEAVMRKAAKDALFMHCLPAHRGEEVAASVIDGPQSVVWLEAENRLHAQKALLELLLVAHDRKASATGRAVGAPSGSLSGPASP